MKLLSLAVFCSSPFVSVTLKHTVGAVRARADSRDHCLQLRDLVCSFRSLPPPFSLLKAVELLLQHPTQATVSAFVCHWKQKCWLLSCCGAIPGDVAAMKQRGAGVEEMVVKRGIGQ